MKIEKEVDVVYIIGSKLGSTGIGMIAYNAVKHLEASGLSYKIFCRGYNKKLKLNKKNIKSFGYLETLSLPLRFLQKKLNLNIDPFKHVNYFFGKGIARNLPMCKIYHTWTDLAPEAIRKAKKAGSVLILEGANSHILNASNLLGYENKKYGISDPYYKYKLKSVLKTYKLYDYVICPSDFVYNSFLDNGFSKDKLILIPYGVDLEKFPVGGVRKDSKFRAIFAGSLQLRKGIQYMLQAWEELKLKNAELMVLGRVWPDTAKIVDKYKNNSSINFIGFDPDASVHMRDSDIFVFPTIEEGSALVTYEAMASGLPMVTTFNSGTVARDGKEGFIVPIRDVGAFKEKIKFLYNNPEIRKKMGVAARKRIERFSWDSSGEMLIEKYREILGKGEAWNV